MAQNIYDDAAFFAGYSQFPRSREGLKAAPEWPALRAMLPDVAGRRVLDLGCGFGAFCRWAAEAGAAEVVGIDLSENMLAEARRRSAGLAISYRRADLEALDLAGEAFDLVFSSLAVHYVADFGRLCRTIRAALPAGGRFVFSTEHPIYAARANPEWGSDAGGRQVFALDDYLGEGERVTDWVVNGVVKHHRVIATIVNTLQDSGLMLDRLEEWGPSDAMIAADPGFREHRIRPMFLLVAARAGA